MKKNRLKIAIQKKGRLRESSLNFLTSCGLKFIPNGCSLIQKSEQGEIDLIFLRDDDIPEYVSRGIVDFAIIGRNVLLEKQMAAKTIRELNFAKCVLLIAVPINSLIKKPKDLNNKRIATTYPQLLKQYLIKNNINSTIIQISGSVEITPELDLADAICDIVQTGNTLKIHKLKPIDNILESQALLVTNNSMNYAKQKLKELLLK